MLYCALMAALWCARDAVPPAAGPGSSPTAAPPPLPRSRWPSRAVPATARDAGAKSWEELPSWLWRDRPWAVAVVLLGAPAVRDHTASFVDFSNRVIDWKPACWTRPPTWPRDQRLLVQTAYEMAFDTPGEVTRAMSEPVTLRDVVRHLDDDEVERIRVAMQIRRGRLEPDEGMTRLT